MTTISLSWSTAPNPDGEGFFVLEKGSQGDSQTFGPIPGYAVESFIKARRQRLEREARKHGKATRIFNVPDNTQ